jgi:drug/metabolite transporter (DMT)-like permease
MSAMPTPSPSRWKTLAAFGVIYFVWGSTFLAIRISVHQIPPLLCAAIRFFVAGAALYLFMLFRGQPSPTRRQWLSAIAMAALIFVGDYGFLFWAEQRVPSGVAAVMLATIPAFMALSEVVILRTQRLTLRLALALLIGLAGVAALVSHSLNLGGAPINRAGAVALLIAAFDWSIASALSRKLPLPESKAMSAGAQMFAGGILLTLVALLSGEFRRFHPLAVTTGAWLALLYLIIAGSIIGFTAYLWLLHHHSPTRVGTYAYVNPLVAVFIGYFFAGEPLGLRTVLGTTLILISVIVITTMRTRKPAAAQPVEEPA